MSETTLESDKVLLALIKNMKLKINDLEETLDIIIEINNKQQNISIYELNKLMTLCPKAEMEIEECKRMSYEIINNTKYDDEKKSQENIIKKLNRLQEKLKILMNRPISSMIKV